MPPNLSAPNPEDNLRCCVQEYREADTLCDTPETRPLLDASTLLAARGGLRPLASRDAPKSAGGGGGLRAKKTNVRDAVTAKGFHFT